MDARRIGMATAIVLAMHAAAADGAGHRTRNFLVNAPTGDLARRVGEAAERYRRDLSLEWLGRELPDWRDPCPIVVQTGPTMGASGQTTFDLVSDGSQPRHWSMVVRGTPERVLDSVLPHEITHTVFATHFGRQLPRWADEGACTTVEHLAERSKHEQLLVQFLTTERGIPFNEMFRMKDYPRDMLPLYAQGYSVARFLISLGGKRKFIQYVGEGMRSNNWTAATEKFYGMQSLSELQLTWVEWVRRGGREQEALLVLAPRHRAALQSQLAQTDPPLNSTGAANGTVRSGTADRESPTGDRAPIVPIPGVAATTPSDNEGPAASSSRPLAGRATLAMVEGSWYARQRDLARQQNIETGAAASALGTVADPANTVRSSNARPPQPERPPLIILEYERIGRRAPAASSAPYPTDRPSGVRVSGSAANGPIAYR